MSDYALFAKADQIAEDFAEIPFDDHDAKILAIAYLELRKCQCCNVVIPKRQSVGMTWLSSLTRR